MRISTYGAQIIATDGMHATSLLDLGVGSEASGRVSTNRHDFEVVLAVPAVTTGKLFFVRDQFVWIDCLFAGNLEKLVKCAEFVFGRCIAEHDLAMLVKDAHGFRGETGKLGEVIIILTQLPIDMQIAIYSTTIGRRAIENETRWQ